jgi:hypothetical protein
MFRNRLVIDDDIRSFEANSIAGQTDNSLNKICDDRTVVFFSVSDRIVGIAGILEDDNVAPPDFPLR